jgi:pyridoxamine 5'-phosphate oxidase
MFMGQENTVELVRRNSATLKPQNKLTRTQSAIHQQPAMISGDKRAVSRAPAAENGETEHARYLANRRREHKRKPDFDSDGTLAYDFDSMDAIDLIGLRREYETAGLRRAEMHSNPIEQFATWFSTALNSALPDSNAMSLATATSEGKPSVRVVLLKAFDQRGFVFFTNYKSGKGRDLDANPQAALAFYWIQLERQVRVTGRVEKTSREESQEYFHSRPRGSQLGAWVSHQSEVIDARRILEARLAEMTERFAGEGVIELPPHWGGYRVAPETIEFWQGRANRLHDRFLYTRQTDGSWALDRLAP